MITRLGGGSFADVYKAREKSTGELVAIKILKRKYKKWEECTELRECKSLQILNKASSNEKGLENIIKLKRIIFINKTGVLNLIFEFMEKDLFILMKSYEPKTLPEDKIKDITYQTLLGLAYMHKYGFFHRDLKPENLLLVGDTVKIADFGLAREIRSIPPYTEYVSTRYYRAPECILKSTNYNSPIDIWALGCVMAEMYLHPQPLFYGANEKEVLYRICSVLGTPTYDTWAEGIQQANLIGFKFHYSNKTELEEIIPNASEEAIDLMKQMLRWDPNKRATAANLLNHKFFNNYKSFNYLNSNEINFDNCKIFTDNNRNSSNINSYKNEGTGEKIKIRDSSNFEVGESIMGFNNTSDTKKENDFSDMLNDTEGFNKILNKLKKEKNEEDKDFEKQKTDNNFNNLFLSIERKLGINLEESKPLPFIIDKESSNKKNNNNTNNKKNEKENIIEEINEDSNTNKIKMKENINPFSFLDFKFKEPEDKDVNDKNKKNDTNTIDLGFNIGNLVNKDNNDAFENAKRLKPIVKNNRRGSARKFLEENDNKIDKLPPINKNNYNNNNTNERKLKYNFSNNLIGELGYEKKEFKKPTIMKNEFSFVNNINGIFENKNKNNNFEINNYNFNGYKRRDNNIYGKNVTLTNNNFNSPYIARNKNANNFNLNINNQLRRGGSNFFGNDNLWDI